MAVLFRSNIRPVLEMSAVSHPIILEEALGHVFQMIPTDRQVHHFPFSGGAYTRISSYRFRALRTLFALCKGTKQLLFGF